MLFEEFHVWSEKEAKIDSTPLEASRAEMQNKVGDKNSFGRYF